jgi:hypothetical protein
VKSNPPQLYPPKQDGVVGILFSKPHRKNVIIKRVENKNKKWLNTINILAKRFSCSSPTSSRPVIPKKPQKIFLKKIRKLRAFSLSSVMMTRHLLSALLAKVLATQQKNKGGGDFSLPPFLPTKRKKKKDARGAKRMQSVTESGGSRRTELTP